MASGEFERRLDATVLDFRAMLAASLEPPRLRRRARAFVVADLSEEKFLPAIFLRKFLQLRALALPPGRDFGCARVRAFREREIRQHADVIERIPELHVGVFVPVSAIGDLAVINRAHRRDDLAPALLEFLRVSKLEPDAKNFG